MIYTWLFLNIWPVWNLVKSSHTIGTIRQYFVANMVSSKNDLRNIGVFMTTRTAFFYHSASPICVIVNKVYKTYLYYATFF